MKAYVRRAVALLSLLSAVISGAFGGKSYFVCPWMQRAAASCCCPADRSEADGPAVSRAPCCNRRILETTASAPADTLTPTTTVPAASGFPGELIRIVDGLASDSRTAAEVACGRGARDGPVCELFELHSSYLI